ncbi:U11/U12 small nuclear ribonucleoprotein 35 kDa protein-like [Paramacrobiotus metropolitanus]|uniref:U11/U12 small nuclear ribonucleoprotein 35 kDa protein-like n=1 Tax=Paramacrobiotus metropolitanus TaxID=2943436 RepID=UPI002445BD61|nr:U11/U12 small nuclear ribonucleoprotein 35 kDa protein-like [Paramacrobiotus metropolitanus]
MEAWKLKGKAAEDSKQRRLNNSPVQRSGDGTTTDREEDLATTVYDPFQIGNINGIKGNALHDRGLWRALQSKYKPDRLMAGTPLCTVFVGRLNPSTTETTLQTVFSEFGKVKSLRLIRNYVTGLSQRYAFIEYYKECDAQNAVRNARRMSLEGQKILVDMECERVLSGWKPRRLGGGFGGKKESGQLRFGCRDKPWRKQSRGWQKPS